MTTMRIGQYEVGLELDGTTNDQNRGRSRWWSVVTRLLLLAVFLEAVFAGAMLSGASWARAAHAANAVLLVVSTVIAGLVAVVTLRRVPHGPRLALILWALAAVLALQAVLGAMSAKGANLLWLHIPLGAALVGFASQAVAAARKMRDA